jgi:uncharacterized protein YjbJ (UPF0337 family)
MEMDTDRLGCFLIGLGVGTVIGILLAPATGRQVRERIKEKRTIMNWDQVEGNWKQFTGKVKEKWGKLTDDDLTAVNGKREALSGRIQERYGIAKEDAERQVDEFLKASR